MHIHIYMQLHIHIYTCIYIHMQLYYGTIMWNCITESLSGIPPTDTTRHRSAGSIQTRHEGPMLVSITTEARIADTADIIDKTRLTRP